MKLDMKFNGYDLVIILVYMIVFSAITMATDNMYILLPLGLPFIFILPGYLVMLAMYPVRHSLKMAERLALTLGLSIFLLPSLGLVVNFTPFGITLGSVMASVTVFSALIVYIIWYRRRDIPQDMQFPPASKNQLPIPDYS